MRLTASPAQVGWSAATVSETVRPPTRTGTTDGGNEASKWTAPAAVAARPQRRSKSRKGRSGIFTRENFRYFYSASYWNDLSLAFCKSKGLFSIYEPFPPSRLRPALALSGRRLAR